MSVGAVGAELGTVTGTICNVLLDHAAPSGAFAAFTAQYRAWFSMPGRDRHLL